MISYVKGILAESFQNRIVVEAGSIGYDIYVPSPLIDDLPLVGSEVKIHTYFQVREDGASLYGFLNPQDLVMFKQLISVNGIGPKGALGVLSVLTPDQLRIAIFSADAKTISKAPGIGLKTAQRVILDLKDKVSPEDLLTDSGTAAAGKETLYGSSSKEAADALVALGYSRSEALKAVKKVTQAEAKDVQEILKEALKYVAF